MERLYIETIRVYNGRVYNITYHNNRCHQTRKHIFNSKNFINLRKCIVVPDSLKKGQVKCRITYGEKIHKVEFEKYKLKNIEKIKPVTVGKLNYKYKSVDRSNLKAYFDERGCADDILMVKNGLLTDTFYANIALRKNGKWYTPKEPLLKGTKREQLLLKKQINERAIKLSELVTYDKIAIFNAMIAFGEIVLDLKTAVIDD